MHKSILLLCLALPLLQSCGSDDKAKAAAEAAPKTSAKTTSNLVLGVARIEPEDGIVDITAGTSGKILSVLVNDGQTVAKGKTLMIIDENIENTQLAQAKSRLAPQQTAIAAQRANVDVLQTRLRNAREVVQRNKALFDGKAGTKQAVDDSRYEAERLEKEVAAAEAQVAQASSRMTELQADVQYYQTVLGQKKVVAPSNGKLLKVNAKTGEYAQPTMKIAEFAPAGSLVAKTEVDEIFADRIVIGQKAFLLSQTSGDTVAVGKVSFAADYLKAKSLFKDQSTEQEDRRVREVHIKIDDAKKMLIGSRVDCIINL